MGSLELPESHLNCFGKCCKWFLYGFNILFMLCGIGAAAVGVWAIVDPTSMRVVVLTNSQLYVVAAFILIGSGAAAIFVSIAGCFGARYESRCLLTIYAVVLMLIFVSEFSAGVMALAFYTQMETFANMEMREAVITKYGMANFYLSTDAYNYMQTMFDCCGYAGDDLDGAQLYQISAWFMNSMITVPPSCCKRGPTGEAIDLQRCQSYLNYDINFINNIGCIGAVLEEGGKFSTILAGAGVGLSILQIFGMVFTFCLYRRI